jgi:hypothetical protein
MSADPGTTASSKARRKRLASPPVEQIVAVHHHSAFGMHVDPLQRLSSSGRHDLVGRPDEAVADRRSADEAHRLLVIGLAE